MYISRATATLSFCAIISIVCAGTIRRSDVTDVKPAVTFGLGDPNVKCSVDSSGFTSEVTDWANSTEFKTSMGACLDRLSGDNFDGTECVPTYPATSVDVNLKPNFGFWKAHSGNFHSGGDCYDQCQGCLRAGIDRGLAVTTWCHYTVPVFVTIKAACQMGFDYQAST